MPNCIINFDTERISNNAGFKAQNDIINILKQKDFVPVSFNYLKYTSGIRSLLIPYIVLKSCLTVRSGCVICKYPQANNHIAIRRICGITMKAMRRRVKTIAIVNDVESIRFAGISVEDEIEMLSKFDYVIVHNERMRDFLLENGLKSRIVVLGMFDYLVEKPNNLERKYSNNIVFAGNLDKSEFLHNPKNFIKGITLNVYGTNPENKIEREGIVYKGKFHPDDISSIEGSWGLVWDGDSDEKLSGKLGEYLKYNYPHKTSLYICANLPLIVPDTSAIAPIILQNKIGITISSLDEIYDKIRGISIEEYNQMCENLKSIAEKLMSGEFMSKAIDTIMEMD